MVNWFRRRRARSDVPTPRPTTSDAVTRKVDLAELTPPLLHVLGQSAYLQLAIFENLSRALSEAPDTEHKEVLGRVAALSLAKHHGLTALIRRGGNQPGAVMEPYRAGIEEFRRRTSGDDWAELLMTSYLTAGFLDDFFVRLAAGLQKEYAERVTAVLSGDDGSAEIVGLIRGLIDDDPTVASRLAMWGRRLVGDTMLVARSAIALSTDHDAASHKRTEEKIEPVFSELIASHTRRMDGLGLTA